MTTLLDLKQIPLHQAGVQKTRSVCGYCGVGCALDIMTKEDRIIGIQPAMELTSTNGRPLKLVGAFGDGEPIAELF